MNGHSTCSSRPTHPPIGVGGACLLPMPFGSWASCFRDLCFFFARSSRAGLNASSGAPDRTVPSGAPDPSGMDPSGMDRQVAWSLWPRPAWKGLALASRLGGRVAFGLSRWRSSSSRALPLGSRTLAPKPGITPDLGVASSLNRRRKTEFFALFALNSPGLAFSAGFERFSSLFAASCSFFFGFYLNFLKFFEI